MAITIAQVSIGANERAEGRTAEHFAKREHIDLNFNYVMEGFDSNNIKVKKVSTQDMLADYQTKSLGTNEFQDPLERAELFRL